MALYSVDIKTDDAFRYSLYSVVLIKCSIVLAAWIDLYKGRDSHTPMKRENL